MLHMKWCDVYGVFLLLTLRFWHLLGLNSIFHIFSHFFKVPMSSWSITESSMFVISLYKRLSSVTYLIFVPSVRLFVMSSVYIEKSNGPKMVPCGTLESTVCQLIITFLQLPSVFCVLFYSNKFRHLGVQPLMLLWSHLFLQ